MKELLLSHKATVHDALAQLDRNGGALTLFVVDDTNVLLGTLTDGDIRRFLVHGGTVCDSVTQAMFTRFAYVSVNEHNLVRDLHKFKERGVKIVPQLDSDGKIITVYNLVQFRSHLPIDAVLMAGGKGERLRPLTEKTPKPLLKVGDKCIIDHNVDRLISYGINHINVTVNYLGDQLEQHYSEPRNGVQVHTIREPQYLGTIGSVKFVEHLYNDTILVMNSDLFTNIDYEDFYLHFIENHADMSVAAVPYNVSIPYGILDLDGRNIKGLLEKPKYNYYANAGIYLVKKTALAEIPDGQFFNATDLVEKLIQQGKSVIRFPLNGTWIDIGNPQEYQKAQDLSKHLR